MSCRLQMSGKLILSNLRFCFQLKIYSTCSTPADIAKWHDLRKFIRLCTASCRTTNSFLYFIYTQFLLHESIPKPKETMMFKIYYVFLRWGSFFCLFLWCSLCGLLKYLIKFDYLSWISSILVWSTLIGWTRNIFMVFFGFGSSRIMHYLLPLDSLWK